MSQTNSRLYVVKTIRGTPPMAIDVAIELKDGKTIVAPAYMSKIEKIYVQYQIDVSGMDRDSILNISGKKAKFIAPSEKECNGQYRVGDLVLLAVVSLDGNIHVCDVPKYAVISIEGREFCGRFNMVEGYEVEYRICLPEDVNPDDVMFIK